MERDRAVRHHADATRGIVTSVSAPAHTSKRAPWLGCTCTPGCIRVCQSDTRWSETRVSQCLGTLARKCSVSLHTSTASTSSCARFRVSRGASSAANVASGASSTPPGTMCTGCIYRPTPPRVLRHALHHVMYMRGRPGRRARQGPKGSFPRPLSCRFLRVQFVWLLLRPVPAPCL